MELSCAAASGAEEQDTPLALAFSPSGDVLVPRQRLSSRAAGS